MRHWLRIYPRSSAKFSSGFTLVEMLVAATLFAVIGLGIMTSFSSGVKLWNRAKQTDFVRCELLLGFETLARDLRQSMDISKIGFEGTAKELSFPTLAVGKVVKMTYRFDPDSGSFNLSSIAMKDLDSLKKDQVIPERVLFKAQDIVFSYLYFDKEKNSYAWAESCPKDKGRFSAIKIQAKLKGEELEKTVFIPGV
ncbi:MAG: prepilin-type N-terminal cleavage/methylation domain-containing protein [Candidatus Omnitrophica bacterium]|nr:prepilin-type N-terminal cleavage/methylation domain-containing protein [Candidatus Omnitrophota bacterium]